MSGRCMSGVALICLIVFIAGCEGLVSFASYYGSHMVLQQAPKRAQIWGYAELADVGKSVALEVKDTTSSYTKTYNSAVARGPFADKSVWMVMLDPLSRKGPYNITATLETQTAAITDVLFGDVWFCSGQSNMVFTVDMMLNATAELAAASKFTEIRVFSAARVFSNVPLYDLRTVMQPWSLPTSANLGRRWQYFSAVCWLYGKHIYKDRGYPIGLVTSAWGGTPVEAWMSPDALRRCQGTNDNIIEDIYVDVADLDETMPEPFGPRDPSELYNAMVQPFLNMTFYGALWYQGESNAGRAVSYNCTFPTMIDTWREAFNSGSQGQTGTLPFGFVQLAPWRDNDAITTGFSDIRWYQTAAVGYVPNDRMRNVFMAVAMDLPDYQSPVGSIHPRDKTTIGHRLAASGLAVAYGKRHKHQGPFPTSFTIFDFNYTMAIEFDNGNTEIQVRQNNGFEVCCAIQPGVLCPRLPSRWVRVPISQTLPPGVHIDWSGCANMFIVGIRYAWRESPCPIKRCAIYSVDKELPLPPFIRLDPVLPFRHYAMPGQASYHQGAIWSIFMLLLVHLLP